MMRVSALFLLVTLCVSGVAGQNAPATPQTANSDPTYQALRHITVGNEAVTVNGVVLNREGAKFTLKSGTVYFLTPVNGKVTGAVFIGEGIMTLDPPTQIERNSLNRLTDGKEFAESYSHLVLRFTDGTYEELKKSGTSTTSNSGEAAGVLDHSQDELRTKLHYNLHGRILQDVLGGTSGLFYAFINGKKYNGDMLFAIDPHGLYDINVAPEEVALFTFDLNKLGLWTAYHLVNEYSAGAAKGTQRNGLVYAQHHTLNTTLERSARLHGDATTTIVAGVDGLRVVPLNLFPTLRIESVTDTGSEPLSFIQQDRHDDPDYFVILPKALAKDETFTIHTIYSGKDAVTNEGAGNYYPVARDDWYPNTYFGDYATYEMTFQIPKDLTMVATGDLISDKIVGNDDVSTWRTEVPIAVAGFNFGKFKKMEVHLDKLNADLQAFANVELPADYSNVGIETTALMKKPFAEVQVAMQVYTDYFGPISYKRVAVSEQTACDYGQSWPTLVYLPICSFFDATVRHGIPRFSSIGVDLNNTFWNAITAHETAHQWWGHTVGWNSYRDQWMSEGFADFSASLYLQAVYTDDKGASFHGFWKDMLKEITAKNVEGRRPIDVGPVTLGYRLNDSKSGFDITRRLIYPKGAYILHMIRMMMWDPKTGDANFVAMMHDFVNTYRNKAATTEDFKAVVEKHITPEMNLTRNGKMDWFFNEYVYGTYLPNEHFEYSFGKENDGSANVHVKLVQSNVDQNFGMLVPLYLEMANGKIIRVGSAPMIGNTTVEQTIPLTGIKETPKRALICYNQDVLATIDQK